MAEKAFLDIPENADLPVDTAVEFGLIFYFLAGYTAVELRLILCFLILLRKKSSPDP